MATAALGKLHELLQRPPPPPMGEGWMTTSEIAEEMETGKDYIVKRLEEQYQSGLLLKQKFTGPTGHLTTYWKVK